MELDGVLAMRVLLDAAVLVKGGAKSYIFLRRLTFHVDLLSRLWTTILPEKTKSIHDY